MLSLFEEDSILAFFRPITKNEFDAVVKNRIAERKYLSQLREFNKETKVNCLQISRTILDSKHVIKNLSISTGSLNDDKNTRKNQKLNFNNYTSNSSYFNNASSPTKREIEETYILNKTETPELKLPNINMSKQVGFDESSNSNGKQSFTIRPRTSSLFLMSSTKSNNNEEEIANRKLSMPAQSIDRSLSSFEIKAPSSLFTEPAAATPTTPSLPQIESSNNHKLSEQATASLINRLRSLPPRDLHKYFDDKDLQRLYTDLCQQRDTVHSQKYPAEHIQKLKKTDPIFAKRHRQYMQAKVCNKAPIFDNSDFVIPLSLSKSTINRQRRELIQSFTNEARIEKPKTFQLEMQKVDMKVKNYIKNFSLH